MDGGSGSIDKLHLTLATPWTAGFQAFLSMEFSRQEYWSGLPCPPPGDLLNPGIKPRSPALQADALPSEPPGHPVGSICFNHFPFSSSDSIISAVLFLIAMILSSASSSLPLNPSSDFFHFFFLGVVLIIASYTTSRASIHSFSGTLSIRYNPLNLSVTSTVFPGGSDGKASACSVGDPGLIPGLGRCPKEGNSYPLQYPGLENSTDCIIHGLASQTLLSNFHF